MLIVHFQGLLFMHNYLVPLFLLVGVVTGFAQAQNEFYLPTRPNQESSVKKGTRPERNFQLHVGFRPAWNSTRLITRININANTPRTSTGGAHLSLRADFKNSMNLFFEPGIISKTASIMASYSTDTSIRFDFKQSYFALPLGFRVNWYSGQNERFQYYGIIGVQYNRLLKGSLWVSFPDQEKNRFIVFNNPTEFKTSELHGFLGLGFDVAINDSWRIGLDGRLNMLNTTFDNGISKRAFVNGLAMYNFTYSAGVLVSYQLY